MTQFLSEQEVDAEFRAVTAVEDFQSGPHRFPYLRLSSTGFELLLYALHKQALQAAIPPDYDSVRVLNEGSDRARDLVLYAKSAPVGTVQCKRYQSGISVPEVLREIIRFILFARLDPALLPKPDGFLYKLVLARDPAETVADLFAEPPRVIKVYAPNLSSYIAEVIEKFASFKGINVADVLPAVESTLGLFRYELVRPVDLDALVDAAPGVQQRFFASRLVVDSSLVESGLAAQSAKIDEILRRTPEPISDADIRTLQDRILEIPESHRFSAGFAKFFGYPQQIIDTPEKLKAFLPRVAQFKADLDAFFVDWLNTEGARMAEDICKSAPVTVTVHPFARQIPAAFLGTVAAKVTTQSEFGRAMGQIIQKVSARPTDETDTQILTRLVSYFQERGAEILRSDFSKFANPPELFETKKSIMQFAVRGLGTEQEIELCLHRGLEVMRDDLEKAAANLRALGRQPRTVVLQGMDFLDSSVELSRFAESVRRDDSAKSGNDKK
jgi:hypothetical protein